MSKSKRQGNTYGKNRGLLIARTVFPMAALLLMTVSLCIPCLRFTTADTGTGAVISVASLVKNGWNQARNFLFGGGDLSEVNEIFSWAVLILVAVCVLTYLIAAVLTVWSSVGAIRYALEPKESGTERALYLTLFPNRIVTCAWQGLVLPLLAFPRLLMLCYDKILYYPVILNLTFPEPLLIGGALYLISLILCILSKRGEIATGISPYRVKRMPFSREETAEERGNTSRFSTASDTDGIHSDIERSSRDEQAERIRQLLNRQDKDTE